MWESAESARSGGVLDRAGKLIHLSTLLQGEGFQAHGQGPDIHPAFRGEFDRVAGPAQRVEEYLDGDEEPGGFLLHPGLRGGVLGAVVAVSEVHERG